MSERGPVGRVFVLSRVRGRVDVLLARKRDVADPTSADYDYTGWITAVYLTKVR